MAALSSSASSPYRCADDVWLTRRRATLSTARDLAAATLPALVRAKVASVARLFAGALGLAGALAVATLCYLGELRHATYSLLATVGVALAVVVTGRVGEALAASRALALPALPALTGASAVDREALLARDPLAHLDARVDRLRRLRKVSLSLPLVAMSLLGPLTLHFPFAAMMDVSARDYGEWIRVSGVIVGVAHLSLARLSLRYLNRLLAAQEAGVPLAFHREWRFALGMVVVASCLPGIVFFAIPPILTAVTGLALVPAMFSWAEAAVREEQLAVDAALTARALGDDHDDGVPGVPAETALFAAPTEAPAPFAA